MVKDENTDPVAAHRARIYNITNEVLNPISITSSLLVICAITYLRIKHKNIANRVSLRLQTYVSIADMLFASFQIMTVNSNPPGNWVCNVAPWGFVFASLLGCFLTVTIAFNLQIIFIYNYINTKRFEKYYVIVPFFLSLILSVVPVAFDALGYDDKEISCWYKHGNTVSAIAWQWTTLHGWVVLSVLYCTFSVITITRRLRKTSKSFVDLSRSQSNSNQNRSSTSQNTRSLRRQLMINQAVKRIVLYPIVPIISFTFNILAGFVFYITKENYFEVSMMSNVGTSSQGLFNALMFCFDPAMRKVWDEIYVNLPKLFKKCDNNPDSIIGSSNNDISLQKVSNGNAVNGSNDNNDDNSDNSDNNSKVDIDEDADQTDTTITGATTCYNQSDYSSDTNFDGKMTGGDEEKGGEEDEEEEGNRVIALL